MPAPSMEGLILSSTTDTQEQVNEAAGIKSAPSPVEGEDIEKREAEAAEAAKTGSESETEHPESEQQKPKGKGGFQKRIDKLTRENYEKDKRLRESGERIEALQREREALLAGKPAADATTPTATNAEPQLADYPNPNEWHKALNAWERGQEAARLQRQEEEEFNSAYEERVIQARQEHEDWEEAFENAKTSKVFLVSMKPLTEKAIKESENGPEIAYYLAKHPDEYQELTSLSESAQVKKVARIEDRLFPKTTADNSPKTKPRTSAPPPITPVGGSTKRTASIDDPNISTEEYRQLRLAQRRGR